MHDDKEFNTGMNVLPRHLIPTHVTTKWPQSHTSTHAHIQSIVSGDNANQARAAYAHGKGADFHDGETLPEVS
jgi:hypothetical protein